MEVIEEIFGVGRNLNPFQMSCRAILVFFITLGLIRVSGRRSFSIRTPLDNIIVILLGAILSRAIVGTSPFIPVIIASLIICLLHRIFGWLFTHYDNFARIVEGEKITIYEKGAFLPDNMKRALLREEDVMLGVRKCVYADNLDKIDKIYLEHNGEISLIKKEL